MSGRSSRFVTVLPEARSKPGKEADIKSFMSGAITASRNDVGCIDYGLHEVEGQQGTFISYERWIS